MTRTQQRIATTNVLAQDVPFSIPAQQKADVVKLDRDTCLRYDLTGGPVYVTREAAESTYIERGLEFFTDCPDSIETGMTVVIAPGLECLFGFDPNASNRDAFFLYIWKN